MTIARLLGSITSAGLLVMACSGGGGSPGNASSSGGGPGDTSTFEGFVAEYCNLFQPCCTAARRPAGTTRCRAFVGAFANSGGYDPARGEACISAARSEATKPTFCEEGAAENVGRACADVLSRSNGTKAPGEPCESRSDCVSTTEGEAHCVSRTSDDATTRRCQLRVRGKEGDDCVGQKTGDFTFVQTSGDTPVTRAVVCWTDDNLFCDPSKKCSKVGEIGAPCSGGGGGCVDSAFCDGQTQTCLARKPGGAECVGPSAAECVDKHYCDEATKKCTATLPAGGACTRGTQCTSASCTNGTCEPLDSLTLDLLCEG